MTLPRLSNLSAYWKDHPPTHIIAAAMAGMKPNNSGDGKAGELPDFALLPDYEE